MNFVWSPPPDSFSWLISMDPSRLNCCPPFAIRPRFGTPAVADEDGHDGDGDGVEDDGDGVGEGGRRRGVMPCQVVSRFHIKISKVVTRPTYCEGYAGSPDGNWVDGDRPPPLLTAAILRAENGGQAYWRLLAKVFKCVSRLDLLL